MQLIYLDLEIDRPEFIEDPTFNVIPNIEDFIDANFDVLDEDEMAGGSSPENGLKPGKIPQPEAAEKLDVSTGYIQEAKKILIWH